MKTEINGFEIIRHLEKRKNNPYCIARCKECGKEWETATYTLKAKISCGCISWRQLPPLAEYINGFRTIRCHGYNTEKKNGRWATVECKVCKRIYECDPNSLKYRNHCGCRKRGVVVCRYKKSHPQLATTFSHMLKRCYNLNDKDYYNYGARGITVCDEWLQDRNTFCEWALDNGFENGKKLSIDRIDCSKGYSPDNCRWVDARIQSRNTRRVKMTMEKALEVREKYANFPSFSNILKLSEEYEVSQASIYLIVQNKTWKEKCQ